MYSRTASLLTAPCFRLRKATGLSVQRGTWNLITRRYLNLMVLGGIAPLQDRNDRTKSDVKPRVLPVFSTKPWEKAPRNGSANQSIDWLTRNIPTTYLYATLPPPWRSKDRQDERPAIGRPESRRMFAPMRTCVIRIRKT
ncbi:hypothetical protein GMOD_00003418 [Pyrenophora seminiperda CCB06]|uniref:Uncharacterized protein n=1 Tax=Pyrenophora seminiperda CCB06 TaxID=1302712 RepID=A0A3M7MIX3_9PLEO|nr:hypothetical protein GMOD_00003418 [Pyrenophora seminiperda CCB06]